MTPHQISDANSKLLRIFFKVVESSTDDFKKQEPWKVYAHALALKLFRNLCTIKNLCEVQEDEITGNKYVDHASVNALTRTALENLLVFSHIFNPTDQSLSEFRFEVWRRCGLMGRQKYFTNDPMILKQKAEELQTINKLKIKIEKSPFFHIEYTENERPRILKGEWMGVNKMRILADNARIHKTYFSGIYNHTSSHSHSSYLSAMQVMQARDLETQSQLAFSNISISNYILTNFISTFVQMSEEAQRALDKHPHAKELFETWHIQMEDWDKIYASEPI